MPMKTTGVMCLLCILLILTNQISAQNICLDFDGNNDYVTVSSLPIGNSDFSVETWFNSTTNSGSSTNYELLLGFGSPGLNIALQNGEMYFRIGSLVFPWTNINPSVNYNDGNWHHISVTRLGNDFTVYVDCIQIWSSNIVFNFNFQVFNVSSFAFTGGNQWLGKIDEVRIWNRALTLSEINATKTCVLTGLEPGLLLYWNFDEGIAAGNNIGAIVEDATPNNYDGNFGSFGTNLFSLTGGTSNYVASSVPMVSPYLNNLEVKITDYATQTTPINQICPSDPVHFGLYANGIIAGPFFGTSVDWYMDHGTGPILVPYPSFLDYSFGVPSGVITGNCSNTLGYTDCEFFAEITVTDPAGPYNCNTANTCTFESSPEDLRICCPISDFNLSFAPVAAICDGDTETMTVCITGADPYVMTPGPFVDIRWSYNATPLTGPSFDDQTCITYTVNAALPASACFTANVSNCNGKTKSITDCIPIHKKPVCGTIDAFPIGTPQNLTQISTSPLVYEVCPGDDAILTVDLPFMDCVKTWQYSYTNSAPWFNLGTSNSIQNTNVLPGTGWPGTNIFYRIECDNQIIGSACPPCYSNTLEIRLKPPPPLNAISGTQNLCNGNLNTLTLASTDPSHTYNWFCNGLLVHTGTTYTYTAQTSACYWVETFDGCHTVTSPQFCVTVCDVIADLGCPQLPNDCACLGDPITLSACATTATCLPGNLQYAWYINNVLQSNTNCTFTHTPPVTGATYKVVVTDIVSGCSSSKEKIIVPCDKTGF